jgi:hypothetical protein
VVVRCRALAEVIAAPAQLDDSQLIDLVREIPFILGDECNSELASKSRPSIDELGRISYQVMQITVRAMSRPSVWPVLVAARARSPAVRL